MINVFALSRYAELRAVDEVLIDGVSIEADAASLKRGLGHLTANHSVYPDRSAASDPTYPDMVTSRPIDGKCRTLFHVLETRR